MNKANAMGIWLAICLVTVTAASCQSSNSHNTTTVNTNNKHQNWHVNFLKGRISSLQPADGSVQITGRVFQSPDVETHTVPLGYKITFPDQHGSKVYTIARIRDDGVLFEYESTFDHRSFRKNLIERDTGTFLLLWVAQTATSAPMTTSPTKALSRDDQIHVLLLRRMLDEDAPAVERSGRTIYVSVGADLLRNGAGESQNPSDAVMAAIAQRSYPIKPLPDYLKSVGGYDQWRKKDGLIDVIWIGPLKWTDANTVEVTVGRNLGPLESSGQHLRIQLKGEQWHIESLGAWIT